ncbi:MAG: hypothetical protein LAO08_12980 [Acidobacteriia bacterium]|nr:hypothetical protein [Terriglobia bacterium]
MSHLRRSHPAFRLFAVAGIVFILCAAGCGGTSSSAVNTGGGGGGNGGGSGPPPDFSLSIQPANVSVLQGSSIPVVVAVSALNGFSSQVSISISGMPAGVTATPSQFSISPSGPQTVALSAAAAALVGAATLTVSATSGSLQHTGQFGVAVNPSQFAAHPPFRTRFLRTDAQFSYGALNFFPQQWFLYDPGTKRFFVSNTVLNRIDVFDAASESLVREIPVPGPWVGDETPDHKTIYMGTQIGDLYEIDPVAMAVKARIPAVQIGPAGFAIYEARVMADGRLAVLGGQGGIPFIDGFSDFGVWNPADNTLQTYASYYGSTETGVTNAPVCSFLENIAEMALTADRKRILLGSADSDDTVCAFDPSTGSQVTVQAYVQAIGIPQILAPPDGKEILIPSGSTVTSYDATGLFQLDQFQVGGGNGFYRFILSLDGNTLYAQPYNSTGPLLAYDWRTHALKGWAANYTSSDIEESMTPMAIDETGLIVGPLGEGVGFLDAGTLHTSSVAPTSFLYTIGGAVTQPSFGPVQGGTQVLLAGLQTTKAQNVYFGDQLATGISQGNLTLGITATAPAGPPGPSDVAVTFTDGGLVLFPEGYSYGPSIVEILTDSSTAEGGGTGTIFGYGFGTAAQGGKADPGLQVFVGGRQATVTSYSGLPDTNWIPFCCNEPIESLQFTWPAGSAGTKVDISVSDSAGSTASKNAGQYLSAVQQFALPGAALNQGIYDPRRDVYYFTDQTKIQVFSRSRGIWLTPIPIPSANRLWGISLSPDGTKLAVSDSNADLIYLLNPDSPSSVRTFSLPNIAAEQGSYAGGLAVTDSGIVYYNAFYLAFSGGWALHKLDTNTGIVTHYDSQAGAYGADAYAKLLLTNDNARLYANLGGYVYAIDTATDATFINYTAVGSDYELALSSNQTWMSGAEYLLDTDLNPESYLALNLRETFNQSYVYGEKLSPDGSLLFAPSVNAIDVFDGRIGTLLHRIALPISLCPNYDALVSDGKDNILVAITGQNGDGIAVIDLSSISEPPPLPYASAHAGNLDRTAAVVRTVPRALPKSADRNTLGPAPRLPHMVVPPRL